MWLRSVHSLLLQDLLLAMTEQLTFDELSSITLHHYSLSPPPENCFQKINVIEKDERNYAICLNR